MKLNRILLILAHETLKIYHLQNYADHQLFQKHRKKSQELTKRFKYVLQVNIIGSHAAKTIAVHQGCKTVVVIHTTRKISTLTI